MSKIRKVAVVVVLLVFTATWLYVYHDEYGHNAEVKIEELYENNKNIYSQFTQRVRDAAGLMNRYEGSFKEIVFFVLNRQQAVLEGPHGIQKSIIKMIEDGRSEFQSGQARLIQAKSSYKASIGSTWTGFWLWVAGYPTIRLADYPIIMNDDTEAVFKEGKEIGLIKF